MKNPQDALRSCWQRALCASALTTVAVAACGVIENRDAVTPLNDISHIVWDEEAFESKGVSLRYTGTALVLNASANWGWALLYELFFARYRERGQAIGATVGGLGVAALAYWVDYRLVPKRLTPGFEQHLSGRSLLFIYLVLALGLALPQSHTELGKE